MNNSKIAIDNVSLEIESPIDTTPILRNQAQELEQIVDAFNKINQSVYWKILQKKVFDGVLENLQRRMRNEKDINQLFSLQGQVIWAEKYCDLSKFASVYKISLTNVIKKLQQHETTKSD